MSRKFVSLCIAFLMLFGTLIQNYGDLRVFADSSSEIVKTTWDPAKWTKGVLTKTGTSSVSNIEMDDGSAVEKTVYLPAAAMVGATLQGNVYANDEDAAASNASLKLDTNVFQINYGTAFADDQSAYPVFSLSYKMYIPADSDKDKLRSLTIPIGNNALANPVINFENGKVTVSQSGKSLDLSSAYTKECTYSAGEWIPVEVKAYFKSGSKLSIGVYVGNELIFHGFRTGNLTDTTAKQIGTTNFKWELYYEIINADNNEYRFVTTYLDDIKISLLTENQKPLPDTDITYFDFDYSKASGDPQVSSSGSSIVARSVKHTNNIFLNHSSRFTSNVSPVTNVNGDWRDYYSYENRGTESDPDYVLSASVKPDAELSGELDMVQNFRNNIEKYTTQTKDCELVLSYDIFIPEGTEENARIHTLDFNGTASSNTPKYTINSRVCNGKLDFYTNTKEADNLLVKRSESVNFKSGEWNTVTCLLKLHYDSAANSYNIMIYGVYNGERIFGDKVTLACDSGTSGAFRITQQRIRIVSVAGGADFETKYDNLNFVYYPAGNYCDNSIWRNANYAYPILLTNEGDGTVNVKARLEGYDNGVLIVAFYDNADDKNLVSLKSLSDRSGENSEYLNLSGLAIPDGSSYAKAFLLNNLLKITPYTLSTDITIE